jgi:5-(carboxyamino)imidazole ribonucleotide synthase
VTGTRLDVVTPPGTLGVLGGGQLGRYALLAARTMGLHTVVLDPDSLAPAGAVADEHVVTGFDDPAGLDRLADRCDVVTTEFENPPVDSLRRLSLDVLVRPSTDAVAIAQDRRAEKAFLAGHGLPIAPYEVVDTIDDIARIEATRATSCILKTARLGYDGKGQQTLEPEDDLTAAWLRLGEVPCVLEERLPLDLELSVLVARGIDDRSITWDVAENRHVDGILDLTVVPARIPPELATEAKALAVRIADALAYVGVLAVELFVVDGALLVNELAPRPHNSGHWTLDAALTSQFEQQVRAACGLGLGDTTRAAPAVAMVNLLGDLWEHGEPDWATVLATDGAHLHLYGKATPRPGRKMGHITVTAGSTNEAIGLAVACRDHARRGLHLGH